MPREKVPFPTRQLFVLALCRICEPIAFMSIFPYIYYMIDSFKITDDKRQISIYAGLVTSAFAFAEFSTGVFWGRMSDRFGRKPILLIGLAGTGVSMILFGFAKSLPVALFARALGGLLNGNIGVLQTTVAEVVTVEAHQPRAYSIMPFIWCLGSIVGSGLGGTLADPVKNWPGLFAPGSFSARLFSEYPYLLANIVCVVVVLFGLTVGILFLEETHEDKKTRRDIGLEVGQFLVRTVCGKSKEEVIGEKDRLQLEETISILADEDRVSNYQSIDSSPRLSTSTSDAESLQEDCFSASQPIQEKKSVRHAFTPQVIINIVGYGILAFHTISFEQLMPILLAFPESKAPPSLPFKFMGGFELSAKTIGFILSIQGVFQMVAQVLIFPFINRKLGSLLTFRLTIFAYPILYFITPYLALLKGEWRMVGVYLILVWKVTAQSLAFPSNAIMFANSAPSKRVLGTLNGVAASSASLCRAFGPTLSGLIQAAGYKIGCSGLSWWWCAVIASIGAFVSTLMVEPKRSEASAPAPVDEETGLTGASAADNQRR